MIQWLKNLFHKQETDLAQVSHTGQEYHKVNPKDYETTYCFKPIEINTVDLNRTYYVCPGDKFLLTINDRGDEVLRIEEDMTQTMEIDRAAVFRIKDDLGFESAIGGLFGKSK